MSGLMIILFSAIGCLIAIFVFIFTLAIFDWIYEDREEKKRAEFYRDNW